MCGRVQNLVFPRDLLRVLVSGSYPEKTSESSSRRSPATGACALHLTSFTHIPSKVRLHQLIVEGWWPIESGPDLLITIFASWTGGDGGAPLPRGSKLGGPRCGRRRVWRSSPSAPLPLAGYSYPSLFIAGLAGSPCASRRADRRENKSTTALSEVR
ncbi:hypothetical protein MTP99_000456 [Tenebrio molitor]|jgi:hypothetical protein|nr:hypothetical protein MTP99_000456 [Tenebrio molitor]